MQPLATVMLQSGVVGLEMLERGLWGSFAPPAKLPQGELWGTKSPRLVVIYISYIVNNLDRVDCVAVVQQTPKLRVTKSL